MNTFYVVLVLAAGYYSYKSCGAPPPPAAVVKAAPAQAAAPPPPPALSPAEQKAQVDKHIAELGSSDNTVVWGAAQALGRMGPAAKDAVGSLIQTFKDVPDPPREASSSGVQFIMIGGGGRSQSEHFNAPIKDALVAIGAPASVELAQCLTTSFSKVAVGYCAEALRQLGPQAAEAVPTLAPYLSLGDASTRQLISSILYQIGTPEAKQAIADYEALKPK